MPPSLSELKVTPSFCFAFKIPDDRAVTSTQCKWGSELSKIDLIANDAKQLGLFWTIMIITLKFALISFTIL